ncbi:MAG: hypothetical protein LBP31_03720 [Holosporales bacterium]|jgi:septal ring factor EnvC (AmiA/AmiB activator)|nr:hypothetical protein [Holosporales bacterium]
MRKIKFCCLAVLIATSTGHASASLDSTNLSATTEFMIEQNVLLKETGTELEKELGQLDGTVESAKKIIESAKKRKELLTKLCIPSEEMGTKPEEKVGLLKERNELLTRLDVLLKEMVAKLEEKLKLEEENSAQQRQQIAELKKKLVEKCEEGAALDEALRKEKEKGEKLKKENEELKKYQERGDNEESGGG